MTTPYLDDDLRTDEGCKLRAYKDTVNVWTVGVGHAHVAPGTVWTQAQADAQLLKDIETAKAALDRNLPWWRNLNDARQDVMVNMTFNMGIGTLLKFVNTLAMIKGGRYADAAANMLKSKWAAQVGRRAQRLAKQMEMGVRIAPAS